MEEKICRSKLAEKEKRWIFFGVLTIIGIIVLLISLVLVGNSDQVYNDIICEYTSRFASNKTVEMNIVYGLLFGGILLLSLSFVISKCRELRETNVVSSMNNVGKEGYKSKVFACALLTITCANLLVYNRIQEVVIFSLVFALLIAIVDKSLLCIGICTYYISVYCCIGLFRLYVHCGGTKSINVMIVAVFATLMSMMPLLFKRRYESFCRMIMVENLFVPCALFLFLSNKYKKGEEIFRIDAPVLIQIFIGGVIAVFIVEAALIWKKQWKKHTAVDDVITLGSCITIMAFNRFDGRGAILPTDMHHPYENIIGFQQVFELKQPLFETYIPVSGMYSIIQGAVLDCFGEGTFANYHITNNLFYLFIIIGIVVLLKLHLDKSYVFLISLMLYIGTYNRSVFVLPIILLLTWPKLIEKKNAWLVTWFLTSLFHGLYYPLYGAATCVAFFPLLIWQIVTFIKAGELKKAVRTIRFWISWISCLVMLIACGNLLLGTLKHMLAMSGQSILADGISRFGQIVPEWFFSYLGGDNSVIRIILYHTFSFMIPILLVWMAVFLVWDISDVQFKGKKIRCGNVKNMFIVLSIVIMPIISYTYTFVRMDVGSLFARNVSVLSVGCVLLLILALNYLEDDKARIIFIVFAMLVPAISNTVGIFGIETNIKESSVFATDSCRKLEVSYVVPDGYVYVTDDTVEKLGTGYIKQSLYERVKSYEYKFSGRSGDFSYIEEPQSFGYYYLLEVNGAGALEAAGTVKSRSATEEICNVAQNNNSLFGSSLIPYRNYYLYHWLMTSGKYYWDENDKVFVPNIAHYTLEEVLEKNKGSEIAWRSNVNVGKTAGAWGSSMDALTPLFSELAVEYTQQMVGNGMAVSFSSAFDGDEADFIYLEFADMENNYEYILYNTDGESVQTAGLLGKYFMKKEYNPNTVVKIKWLDNIGEVYELECEMHKGKLLIPLGIGKQWLFNQHNLIAIYIYENGCEMPVPEIKAIRMLKLQEID